MRFDHGRGHVSGEGYRRRRGEFGSARGQRPEASRHCIDRHVGLDVAEHLHLDRSAREQRLPQGAERLRGRRGHLIARRRAPALVARMQQPFEVALQHSAGRGIQTGIGRQRKAPRPCDRVRIPARRRQLGRHQPKLVGQVLG